MSIDTEIVVLCTLLAAGTLYFFRPMLSSAGHSRRDENVRSGLKTYRAASIACEGQACSAARDLRGEKFLLRETPHLPLATCDKGECTCHYAYYDDRRSSVHERRDLQSQDSNDDERRIGNGRRRTDWRLH